MIFGGHVSIAGGLLNGIKRAKQEGFAVLQIFVTSPRSFRTTNYTDEEISAFREEFKAEKFQALFFHAIYLVNFGSEKETLRRLSRESVTHYLQMGEKLGATGTIVHLGTDTNREQIIDDIKVVLSNSPNDQHFIVENMASQKRFGSSLEELVYINESVGSGRLGFCVDTQHLFASGVDVANGKIFANWLEEFDKRIGIKKLICVHANDSKTELGSGHDRHDNIGEGLIGRAGFKNILKQPLLKDRPFILETPGIDKKGPDKKNLDLLKVRAV